MAVCVFFFFFIRIELLLVTVSLLIDASSQKPELLVLLSWTPITSECCLLKHTKNIKTHKHLSIE